ncbi:Phosphate transporter [Penicillium concentricum]|uniref:Phosphate transporter n=1 Tax=Penicillium concentricum TaxID=293559 RepID=A0A9W9RJI5_9EURO|nr:Phosphate transporter [Penicillium concentricum]KAJ5360019.1 Phosphate transporter [Penicillium concentricum]
MVLGQYDYIFAIGTIFAFLDAWNIGANDCANSWSTSVSSRSLKHWQAMILGSIMEFAGAVGVGNSVSDTIRTKIVKIDAFAENAPLLMLGMCCAVVASSIYLTICTKIGLPVSTTHSILGGVLGMGIALLGADDIIWWGGDINSGVVQVFLAWVIAPLLSGVAGALIFLITKYGILLQKNPALKALYTIPFYFLLTTGLLTMLIVWKGGSSRIDLEGAEIAGTIIGVGVGMALISAVFLCPWIYRRVIMNDWQLKPWDMIYGPLLLRRGEVPPPPAHVETVRNYYRGHKTLEELEAERSTDVEQSHSNGNSEPGSPDLKAETQVTANSHNETESMDPDVVNLCGPRPEGAWYSTPVLFWLLKKAFFNGIEQDIVSAQKGESRLAGDLEKTHAHAEHYDNEAEYMFSFLQILTACTASFTHGANDVANAVGPYATIYAIWKTGALEGAKTEVPMWILVFGGAAIAIGIWTYGYHIMRNLGNRLTLHSPSRGFAMELGAAIAVIVATRLKLPVSTTQCITGATVGVGLCNGTWRTINWRMVAWIYMGWIITLPCAGIISGCLTGIIVNAPRWGMPN